MTFSIIIVLSNSQSEKLFSSLTYSLSATLSFLDFFVSVK